jgi:hypothetical protein
VRGDVPVKCDRCGSANVHPTKDGYGAWRTHYFYGTNVPVESVRHVLCRVCGTTSMERSTLVRGVRGDVSEAAKPDESRGSGWDRKRCLECRKENIKLQTESWRRRLCLYCGSPLHDSDAAALRIAAHLQVLWFYASCIAHEDPILPQRLVETDHQGSSAPHSWSDRG